MKQNLGWPCFQLSIKRGVCWSGGCGLHCGDWRVSASVLYAASIGQCLDCCTGIFFGLEKASMGADMWGDIRSLMTGEHLTRARPWLACEDKMARPFKPQYISWKNEISGERPNHTKFQSPPAPLRLNQLKFKDQSPELKIPIIQVLLTLGSYFWSCENNLPAT